MSNNHNIPGLRKIVDKNPAYGIATRLSGRNLATFNYIASLEAERRGVVIETSAVFDTDGSLRYVTVRDSSQPSDEVYRPDGTIFPGTWVVLPAGADEAQIISDAEYNSRFAEV